MYEVVVNSSAKSRWDGEVTPTGLAGKKIILVRTVFGNEHGLDSTSDPALGTLEITPERRRKIERALTRQARRLQREFEFRYLKCSILYFFVKVKITTLKVIGYLNGYLFKFGIRIGHDWLI